MQKHSLNDLRHAFLFHISSQLPWGRPEAPPLPQKQPVCEAPTPVKQTPKTPLVKAPLFVPKTEATHTASYSKMVQNLTLLKALLPTDKLFYLPPCDFKASHNLPALCVLISENLLQRPRDCRFLEAIALKLLNHGQSALFPLEWLETFKERIEKSSSAFFIQQEELFRFPNAGKVDDLLYNWHEKPIFIIPSEDLYAVEGVRARFWERVAFFFEGRS